MPHLETMDPQFEDKPLDLLKWKLSSLTQDKLFKHMSVLKNCLLDISVKSFLVKFGEKKQIGRHIFDMANYIGEQFLVNIMHSQYYSLQLYETTDVLGLAQ